MAKWRPGRIAGCVGVALATGGVTVCGIEAEARAATLPIVLVCNAKVAVKGQSGLTEEAICARFAAPIAAALNHPVKLGSAVPAGTKSSWIRIAVRLHANGRAEAALTSKLHAEATNYPVLAVHVMDKPLQLREIDLLAKRVAEVLRDGLARGKKGS